ncbi:MAG: hypothetical protein R3B82_07350 [Sandaracinaceae bacterium]
MRAEDRLAGRQLAGEQEVEILRVADERARERAARPEEADEAPRRAGLVEQELPVGRGVADAGEEVGEPAQRRLGIRRTGDLGEQGPAELGGLLAGHRAERAVGAAREPREVRGAFVGIVELEVVADRLRDHVGWRAARDGVEQPLDGARGRLVVGQERLEERRDLALRLAEGGLHLLRARVAEARREALPGLAIRGEHVGLVPAPHVDAVLDPTEHRPRARQRLDLARGHEPRRVQPAQPLEGAGDLELRVPPAPHELERLHEELRLADPAAPELHVAVLVDAELAARALQHLLHRIGDLRIDLAPEHEGLERVEQLPAEDAVSADRPRAEERGALPRAAPGLVVALGARQRVHQRPARALGSEPQVDAKAEAVFGDLAHRGDRAAHDARVELVDGEVRALHLGVVGRVEEDEVDVAPEVELEPAELPHPEHRQRDVGRPSSLGLRFARAVERRVDDHRREVGHLGGRLLHVRDPQDLAQRDPHDRAVPKPTQRAAQIGPVGGEPAEPQLGGERVVVGRQLQGTGQDVVEQGGVRLDQRGEAAGVLDQRSLGVCFRDHSEKRDSIGRLTLPDA